MPVPDQPATTPTATAAWLRRRLISSANARGGWGYYEGKGSRIEPTCWALMSLASGAPAARPDLSSHARFLAECQRSDGWLVDAPGLPINVAFNAMTAVAWLAFPELATAEMRRRLVATLTSSKGVQAADTATSIQNNRLQGWSWVSDTFSWVEPTAWGVIALRKARSAGLGTAAIDSRITEGERLLVDRVCNRGGWNFGNADMFEQALRPYVPTTALGLLAMRESLTEPAVARSLAFLDTSWDEEPSSLAAGLSAIALRACGRNVERLNARLLEHVAATTESGRLVGLAVAALALSEEGGNVFGA